MIGAFFHEAFYRPLLNALVFLTDTVSFGDLGIAVVLLTILVRLILFPFTHHSVKSQAKLRALEPEITKIKHDFKDKQEEQARRILALYKEHGVDPVSGCLILFIQLPILIALYQVFWKGINADSLEALYSFVPAPEHINIIFLGLVDLSQKSISLAILAAITQFIQLKLALPKTTKSEHAIDSSSRPDMARMMNAQMLYMMPVIVLIAGLQFPAAVGLYWTTMNLFAIMHETIVRRKAEKISPS